MAAASAAMLFLVIGAFLWRRRKRRQLVATISEGGIGKAELPGEGVHRELGQEYAVYEKGTSDRPPEMANTERAELETDWTGWEAPAVVEVELSRPTSLAPDGDRDRSRQDLQALAKPSRAEEETGRRLPSVDIVRSQDTAQDM